MLDTILNAKRLLFNRATLRKYLRKI